jgi:transposase-like protein
MVAVSERQGYWLALLRECEESGETTKAYAEARGLSVRQLYKWRKKLVEQGVWPERVAPARFDRVELRSVPAPKSGFQITLPNGIEICVSSPIEQRSLETVLSAAMSL